MLARIQGVAGNLAVALHGGQDQRHIDIRSSQSIAVISGKGRDRPIPRQFGQTGAQVAGNDHLAWRPFDIQAANARDIFFGNRLRTNHPDTHQSCDVAPSFSGRHAAFLGFR